MEKDIGKIGKNDTTDIVLRIDDFGGKRGFTIREFVTSDRYTGFTKSGVRISAEDFPKFKEMVNSVDEKEMAAAPEGAAEDQETLAGKEEKVETDKKEPEDNGEGKKEGLPDY